jgi:hypothetical protein
VLAPLVTKLPVVVALLKERLEIVALVENRPSDDRLVE